MIGEMMVCPNCGRAVRGICTCDKCNGKGINMLGKLLRQVREEIKREA